MSPEGLKKILAEIPLRRAGDVLDVGHQAVLLLSDRLSGYTTGATVVVDGGLQLRPLPFLSDEEIMGLNSSENV
jgi:3-oxoacyl-[acyl-carrier protein] reductase